MSRKYTHIRIVEDEIITMRAAGKTRQEIADELGLTKVQIKNWINGHNKREAALDAGNLPKARGRPRKRPRTAEEEKLKTKLTPLEQRREFAA